MQQFGCEFPALMTGVFSIACLSLLISGVHGDMDSRGSIITRFMYQYRQDCGTESHLHIIQPGAASLTQQANVPGAGIKTFSPFKTVLKDGFLEVDCVKDYMYYRGDKFGDNKHDYKLGPISNVSIVHYDAYVASEDKAPMTQEVCFEFCRTVPNMGFFGLVNGRGCYCTPYFKPMAGDSSMCTSTCEGDPVRMCGGKSKSSIFAMHMCDSTKGDLSQWSSKANALKSEIDAKAKTGKALAKDMQDRAVALQKSFGAVGDSAATDMMQDAKIFAGSLLHKAENADGVSSLLLTQTKAASTIQDFSDPKEVTKAERIMEDIEETIAAGEAAADGLDKVIALASPTMNVAGASKQYYPVMYFVDKTFDKAPSTCDGSALDEPIVGLTKDSCASSCDDDVNSCVGFQYFGGSPSLCFLLSTFKTASYYTGCDKSFLQVNNKAAPFEAVCYAKLSRFEGTSLKPDPSGKSPLALKSVTKAARCFE
jgi:hypothetical protein